MPCLATDMSRKFHNLADRASNFPECVVLVDSTLDILGKQIEEKINACTSTPRFPGTSVTDASPPNELLSNARLKKKEVETKTSKRRRSLLDKKHKIRKKRENQTTSHFGEEIQEVLEEARGDSAQVANDNVCTGKENESKVCDGNLSFTQLLMGPIIDDVFTRLW